MKKTQLILLSLCTALLWSGAHNLIAQTTLPHIYKDWTVLGESVYHAEISYRIIKCDTKDQIHLSINNKTSNIQSVVAVLTIKNNEDGISFNKELNHLVLMNSTLKAECGGEPDLDNLKIDIPANYNPSNLTVAIQFPNAFLVPIKDSFMVLQNKY